VNRYKQLTVQLKRNPGNSMFSSEEAKMIGTAQNNTNKYEKGSNSTEKRFFKTLLLYGKELATLCGTEVWDDGLQNDKKKNGRNSSSAVLLFYLCSDWIT
jgi:hypothetical protein